MLATAFDALAHMFTAAQEDGKVSLFRLHALLYLAHGRCLASHDRPLVDSGFEAWLVAPVNKDLYESQHKPGCHQYIADPDRLDPAQQSTLTQVVRAYRLTPDPTLRRIVRDPVWANTRDRAGAGPNDGCTARMPDEEIARFFRAIAGDPNPA